MTRVRKSWICAEGHDWVKMHGLERQQTHRTAIMNDEGKYIVFHHCVSRFEKTSSAVSGSLSSWKLHIFEMWILLRHGRESLSRCREQHAESHNVKMTAMGFLVANFANWVTSSTGIPWYTKLAQYIWQTWWCRPQLWSCMCHYNSLQSFPFLGKLRKYL